MENHEWIGRAYTLIGAWDESKEALFSQYCDTVFARSIHANADRQAALSALGKIMNMIQGARTELRLITGGPKSRAFDAGAAF